MTLALLDRLGRRVRDARRGRGWTARETAARSGLSLRFYAALEAGRANISIARLAGVAGALGAPLGDLLREESRPSVALLGLRGAGKSTIGPRLAKALACPFVELDERVERAANLTLAEIFNIHGEAYYRELEADAVREILGRGERVVVALSGGIVRNDGAFQAVRRSCVTVWLRARPEDHMKRVWRQGDRRPMADRANAMEELRSILREREPLYRTADLTIDTSSHTVVEAVRRLRSALHRR